MRKKITCLSLLALISCKDDTVKPITGTEITEVEAPADSTHATVKTVTEEEALHDEVVNVQKNIENSVPADRRNLMDRYLSYKEKVDGAVAETYFAFIFDYEEAHTKDFYSVLTEKDTAFVRTWAEHAAMEATLGIETHADGEAFFQDLQDHNEKRMANLNDTEKKLFILYNDKLEKSAWKIFNSAGNK